MTIRRSPYIPRFNRNLTFNENKRTSRRSHREEKRGEKRTICGSYVAETFQVENVPVFLLLLGLILPLTIRRRHPGRETRTSRVIRATCIIKRRPLFSHVAHFISTRFQVLRHGEAFVLLFLRREYFDSHANVDEPSVAKDALVKLAFIASATPSLREKQVSGEIID